jgi:hypothetical protein
MSDLLALGEDIKAALPGAVTSAVIAFDELTIHAEAARSSRFSGSCARTSAFVS